MYVSLSVCKGGLLTGQLDVPCNEICPFCHKTFTVSAHKYVAHKCKPRDPGDKTKDQYVKGRHQELRRLTTELLHQASLRQRPLLNGHGSGKKRDRKTAGLDSPIQEGKRMAPSKDNDASPLLMFHPTRDLDGMICVLGLAHEPSNRHTGTSTSPPTDINGTMPSDCDFHSARFLPRFPSVFPGATSEGFRPRAPILESLTMLPNSMTQQDVTTSPELTLEASALEFLTTMPNYTPQDSTTSPEFPLRAPILESLTMLSNSMTRQDITTSPEFTLEASALEFLTTMPNYTPHDSTTSPEFPSRAPIFESLPIIPNHTIRQHDAISPRFHRLFH